MTNSPALVGEEGLRALRVRAQLLHRVKPGVSPGEIVRRVCGVQAQELSSATHALRARAVGLTSNDVHEARVGERSVVRTWAMRGTLHLLASDDVGWLLPLVASSPPRCPAAAGPTRPQERCTGEGRRPHRSDACRGGAAHTCRGSRKAQSQWGAHRGTGNLPPDTARCPRGTRLYGTGSRRRVHLRPAARLARTAEHSGGGGGTRRACPQVPLRLQARHARGHGRVVGTPTHRGA